MGAIPARACALATVLALLLSAGVAQAAQTKRAKPPRSQTVTPAALDKLLSHELRRAGGTSSALVVDETTGKPLFTVAPEAERLPASVEKLFTTSAALFDFGPSGRLQTGVYGVGTLAPGGLWDGTLYLRGGGDPTFGDQHFDAVNYGAGATVQQLAAALRVAGIRGVRGAVVGDESYFDSLRGTPATGYAGSMDVEGLLSGLSYDAGFQNSTENSFQPHPTQWAARAFASVLRSNGFSVPAQTPIYAGITPPDAQLLAAAPSPPMATLIHLTNAPSDNYFAETLVKDLGARFGTGGTTAAGAAVIRTVMAEKLGLHPILNDGSGLSRFDRSTAADVVSLLAQMRSDQDFVGSLAVSGVAGTMRYEMLGTPAVNNCRGKTGTLRDVANLAGYCTAANGDQLVFAFLMNGLRNSNTGHEIEDQMGAALAEYDAPTAVAQRRSRSRIRRTAR